MKGLIFSIKRYSVHDGPGIRVTFFLKGCPLNCMWCHNPEGILPFPQEIVHTRKIGDKEFPVKEEAGRYYTIDEVMEIIRKEDVFIRQSGGGVTFSGGEPMMQSEFLTEALNACKSAGYHTAVDTSGHITSDSFQTIIPFTDLFLFDIKHLDNDRHIRLTGFGNDEILKNYFFLSRGCREIWVRIPVIPGLNDEPDHLVKLRDFLLANRTTNLTKICLLPFHKTGTSKYWSLNKKYRMTGTEQPSAERMKELQNFFSETGIKVKIGG